MNKDVPHTLALGDLNEDGWVDIAVATSAGLVLLFGEPDGPFPRRISCRDEN